MYQMTFRTADRLLLIRSLSRRGPCPCGCVRVAVSVTAMRLSDHTRRNAACYIPQSEKRQKRDLTTTTAAAAAAAMDETRPKEDGRPENGADAIFRRTVALGKGATHGSFHAAAVSVGGTFEDPEATADCEILTDDEHEGEHDTADGNCGGHGEDSEDDGDLEILEDDDDDDDDDEEEEEEEEEEEASDAEPSDDDDDTATATATQRSAIQRGDALQTHRRARSTPSRMLPRGPYDSSSSSSFRQITWSNDPGPIIPRGMAIDTSARSQSYTGPVGADVATATNAAAASLLQRQDTPPSSSEDPVTPTHAQPQPQGKLLSLSFRMSPGRKKLTALTVPKSPRTENNRRRWSGPSNSSMKSPKSTPLQRMRAMALGSSHRRNSKRGSRTIDVQVPDLENTEPDVRAEHASESGESSSDSDSEHSESLVDASGALDTWSADDAVPPHAATASQHDAASTSSRLPNSFLGVTPDRYDYLDHDLVKRIGSQNFSLFAREHHMMIKAILQLLAERDHIGVEADINDKNNIMKKGPLKKKFTKLYFVKYVEIRKGNLAYYEDSDRGEQRSRKVIHLRKYTCKCRIPSRDNASTSGYFFEIIAEGQKSRWMAKSEEERQGWIRAINKAMIGNPDDEMQESLDVSLYENAIDAYHSFQSSFHGVDSIDEYRVAAESVVYQQRAAASLRIPLQWFREDELSRHCTTISKATPTIAASKARALPTATSAAAAAAAAATVSTMTTATTQVPGAPLSPPPPATEATVIAPVAKRKSQRHLVQTSISEFWYSLCHTPVKINGHLVDAHDPYSAERVVGALTRCILEFDRCDPLEEDLPSFQRTEHAEQPDTDHLMTEVQSMSYARTILSTVLRSRRRKDSLACLRAMCGNPGVVRVEVKSEEAVHVDVSFAGDDFSGYEPRTNDVTGWLSTKTKKTRKWRERYFVVSEGVLSHYEKADPRPHGLRGQLVLGGATLKSLDDRILQIQTNKRDQERQLRFNSRGDFIKWREVLLRTIDSTGTNMPIPEVVTGPDMRSQTSPSAAAATASESGTVRKPRMRVKRLKEAAGGSIKAVRGATASGMKAMKGATASGMKSIKEASGLMAKSIRGPKTERKRGRPEAKKLEMLITSTRNIQGKREPTVQVVVQSTSVCHVLPDRSDCDRDEGTAESNVIPGAPILVVHAKVFQAFLLSGGPTGRLARGDALIEFEFQNGADSSMSTAGSSHLEPPFVL